jgi:hypothetical protein
MRRVAQRDCSNFDSITGPADEHPPPVAAVGGGEGRWAVHDPTIRKVSTRLEHHGHRVEGDRTHLSAE